LERKSRTAELEGTREGLEKEIVELQELLRVKQEEHVKCVEELRRCKELDDTVQVRLENDKERIAKTKVELSQQLDQLGKENSESATIVESRQAEIAVAESARDEHSAAMKTLSTHFERVDSTNEALSKLHELAMELMPKIKETATALFEKKAAILTAREKIVTAEKEIATLAEKVGSAQKEMIDIRRRISNAEAALPTLEESKKAFVTAKNFKQAAGVMQQIKELIDQKSKDERALATVTETLKTSAERQKEVAAMRESLSAELLALRQSLDPLLYEPSKPTIGPKEKSALVSDGVDPVVVALLLSTSPDQL
jgi:chromosome segregation ATPase